MIQLLHRIVSNRHAAAVLLGLHAWMWWKLDAQGRAIGNFTHHLVAQQASGKPPPPPLP